MITKVVQRWRNGRDSYRPAGEVIDTSAFEVAELVDDTTPKTFVEAHHYAGTFPPAKLRYGLYRRAELVGVAVLSVTWRHVLEPLFGAAWGSAFELGRFVLLDDVAANGETWFLARAFELAKREGVAGLVSFSDPMERQRADGSTVFRGHIGTIYQAHNATYLGQAARNTVHLLPDGSVFPNRCAGKIRALEPGWRYAAEKLEAVGAPRFEGEPRAWLHGALAQVTRTVRHPGNYRYAWGFTRAARRELERRKRELEQQLRAPLSYPKARAA